MSEVNYFGVEPAIEALEPADPFELYLKMIPEMGKLSLRAMETEAFSYRGFHVGSTLLAYNDTLADHMLFTSGNYKLMEGIKKHCAEMFVLDAMNAFNYSLEREREEVGTDMGKYVPVGLVTVATSDKEKIREVTKKADPTLHMCDDCLQYYSDDLLVNPSSLISVTMPKHRKFMEVNRLLDYILPKPTSNIVSVAARKVVSLTNEHNWEQDKTGLYRELVEAGVKHPNIAAVKALQGMRIDPYPPEAYTGPAGLVR